MTSEARVLTRREQAGLVAREAPADAVDGQGPRPDAPGQIDPGASAFVWLVWALMLAINLALIARFGNRVVPFFDDNDWVPVLTGDVPLTATWLWEQNQQHRMAVGKFLWVSLLRLTDGNLCTVAVLGVLLQAALASALIWTAKSLRGHLRYSDAFLPLAALNPGSTLLQYFAAVISHSTAAVPVVVLLIIIVLGYPRLTPRAVILAGLCLVALPLCNGSGLPLALALSFWLGCAGLSRWRSAEPDRRRDAILMWFMASAALLVLALYMIDYKRVEGQNPGAGIRASLRTAAQFVAMGLGPAAPRSAWKRWGAGVLAMIVASGAALLVAWWKHPRERLRASGLLLFLGAFAILAAGIGYGRSGYGIQAGTATHYLLMAYPVACCVYFVWGIYGGPRVAHFLQMCMFTIMCILFQLNVQTSIDDGRNLRGNVADFSRDLLAGAPPTVLATRHTRHFWGDDDRCREAFAENLRRLHRARIGLFRRMQDDPPCREVSLSVEPSQANRASGNGDGQSSSGVPCLTFTLPRPQRVYAVHLKYNYASSNGMPVDLRLRWERSGDGDHAAAGRTAEVKMSAVSGMRTATILIDDTLDHFRLEPDCKPGAFKLEKMTLLLPGSEAPAPPRT